MKENERVELAVLSDQKIDPAIALQSLLLSTGLFLVIPYMQIASEAARQDIEIRPVETAVLETALPAPSAGHVERASESVRAKDIDIPEMKPQLPALDVRPRLDLGDFGVAGISAGNLAETISGLGSGVVAYDLAASWGEIPPQPLFSAVPVYPISARMRGIEGFVDISLTIAADGTVADMEVVDSYPEGEFERSALRAASRWRFEPFRSGSESEPVKVRQRFIFKLD